MEEPLIGAVVALRPYAPCMKASGGEPERGWYRQQDGRERLWDGHRWTDKYRDPDAPPPSPEDRSPADVDEKAKGKRADRVGQAIALGVVVIIIACCGWFQSLGDDEGDSGGAALTACHNAVEAQIKNPSTADFSLFDTTITETQISGEVTAENDFGAEKTLRYVCTMSGSTVTRATVTPR